MFCFHHYSCSFSSCNDGSSTYSCPFPRGGVFFLFPSSFFFSLLQKSSAPMQQFFSVLPCAYQRLCSIDEIENMDLGGLLSVTAIPLIQSEPQGTVLRILYDLLCEHLMAVMEKKPTKGYKLPILWPPKASHSH